MAIVFILILVLAFYLLAVVSDEFFVPSLEVISERLKLAPDVAGATFMAVGSSAPELFTSLIAVIRGGGVEDIGAGTIVGSAIFNILVIIGASALYRQAKLNWQPVVRDTMFYALSIVMLLVAFWDGKIVLQEALVFVGMYVAYLVAVVNWKKWFPYSDGDVMEVVDEERSKSRVARASRLLLSLAIPDCTKRRERYVGTFVMSVVAVAVLSFVLVESAVELGHLLHINPVIISLTVLAAGTSVPDLLSSMIVAKKGRGDMAISNSVGSNIFDILVGLGGPWVVVLLVRGGSVGVATENLKGSVFLLFATLLAVFFLLALREWKIGPKAGWLLIGTYVVYLCYTIASTLGVINLTPL